MHSSIGVWSGNGELTADLRRRCPAWTFEGEGEAREACRIIVVDRDAHSLLDAPPRKSLVRVVLSRDDGTATRRQGEIHLDRDAFLADAPQVLGFAVDLADAVTHAAQLEQEVGYL